MDQHNSGQVVASAAEIYEQFFVPALFAEWPERILKLSKVTTGDRVLDVACGTGVLARKTAELVGASGSVVGLDMNKDMLAVAARREPDIEWKVGQAESLPFDDDSFDKVVSQFGLMFFEDQVKAIMEMVRLLRPGGKTAVAVWGSLAETPGYAAVAEILADLFGSEVAKSTEAPYSLGDKDKLASLFAEAGVTDITIDISSGQARFASIEAWIYTDIKGWTLADVIDDAEYERLKVYAPPKLAQFVQTDGSVTFATPAHIVTFRK
jgi:ubiquinone/menaquinone biosynthesis C-methylase UbiE